MQQQVLVNPNSTFWGQVGSFFSQLQGLADGFNAATHAEQLPYSLTLFEVFKLNFVNEYGDVAIAVADDAPRAVRRNQHCSAMVKVTKSDLLVAQDTWDNFENTIRTYKVYNIDGTVVAFSSMAGFIASGDDWYITSNLLSSLETTNGYYNNALAVEYVVPSTVSEFLRVMVANFVASSAPEWVALFQYNNSGTYCNQWMVVDYNLYTPGATGSNLPDDLMWVAEQIPGNVTSADVTPVLRNTSYWGSYNIPYFRNIFDESGFEQEEREFGSFFNHHNNSRAEIFRRNQSDVVDLSSMQALMRYNNWKEDPLSTIPNCANCNPSTSPMLSIASRGDLVPLNAVLPANASYSGYFGRAAFGAVDCKITNYAMIQLMQGIVISGPTTYNDNPVFSWTGSWAGMQPDGAPLVYNFSWQTYGQVYPDHGYFAGLSNTKDVIYAVIGGTLGLFAVGGAAITIYFRSAKRSTEEYAPLA
jgi:hypothetical protein